MFIRRGRRSIVLAAIAATVTGLLFTAPAQAVTGHPAGLVGTPIKLYTQSFSGYDVAANRAGTAYIGWISPTNGSGSTDRAIHLCKLPLGATSCVNGVQTIASLGVSSASGLRVMVDGNDTVHLVWFHDTAESINGPFGAAIAEATAAHGLNLTAAQDIAAAPSFGQMLAAQFGPGGSIWTVSYAGTPSQTLYVWNSATSTTDNVSTPWGVGYAQLAFASGTPVLAIEKYGSISTGPSWASRSSGGVWSSFHALAHTWAVSTNAALATTKHGLRIVTAIDNASYRPVISKWTGTGFTARQLTTDSNSCAPNTHDGSADPSGRLLDVSWECNDVTITNYADALHSAIVRLHVNGTPTVAPQIASGVRGFATVAYTVEASSGGDILRAARIRLPDSTVTVKHSATAGRVSVTGPRSCLPPVNVRVGLGHSAAKGWTFKSGSLRLNGNLVSGTTVDGAKLKAGSSNTLVGRAVFARNGNTSTVKASLGFTTCAAQ
jgi:hypothetical protein